MEFFIYARKSTDDEERQMLSIEAQLAELREYASSEGLTVVSEFVESRTAKEPGRPIFNDPPSRGLRRDRHAGTDREWGGVDDQRCLRANSRPEPDFRYFSKATAFSRDLKEIAVSRNQGLCLDVWGSAP